MPDNELGRRGVRLSARRLMLLAVCVSGSGAALILLRTPLFLGFIPEDSVRPCSLSPSVTLLSPGRRGGCYIRWERRALLYISQRV